MCLSNEAVKQSLPLISKKTYRLYFKDGVKFNTLDENKNIYDYGNTVILICLVDSSLRGLRFVGLMEDTGGSFWDYEREFKAVLKPIQ